ncbi:MAG: hypothetical protein HY958_10845 [Bacteroidia bacterium]|nr:hypothetical protein [Bacteroidia bacterium]
MKQTLLIIAGLLISSVYSFSQKSDNDMLKFGKGSKYKKEWAKIDSLEKKGLPKSALDVVEQIFKKAKAENNPEQLIKTFIFRMKLKSAVEEYVFEKKIKELENEISNTAFPSNAIMHSMVAEMYWMYYQSNRWKFYNRTATVGVNSDDIQTWDLNRLADQVIKHYQASLANADSLQRFPVNALDDLITAGNMDRGVRPTLYDFLAHRAIGFFSNTELTLTKPAETFELKEDFFFTDASEFAKLKFVTPDSLSLSYYAVKTLQNLVIFHLNDNNKQALIDVDIDRFEYVYKKSVHELKDSLYLDGIKKFESKYKSLPYSGEVSYLIAKYYSDRAAKYNPLQEETNTYKWDHKTAYEICDRVINSFPKTTAALKCESLRFEITRETLNFNIEKFNFPDQKIAVKINYKNAAKAYIRISPIDKDKYKKLGEKYYGKDLIERILKETEVKQLKAIDLPDDKDMMSHSVEALMDNLPIGTYIILVSDNEKFNIDKKYVAMELLTVTNISYIERRKDDGSYDFYTVHRITGDPLDNVNVTLWYSEYNYKTQKYETHKGGDFVSSKDGYFRIPDVKNNYRTFFLTFKKDNDFLSSDDSYYYGYYAYQQPKQKRTFFFMDRAIYRPGQTAYFKGLILDTDGETNEIAKNFSVTVTFYDVNYQKVKDQVYTTNEYGTFSGTVDIPTGVLNGQMQIATPYGNKYFSVEEYKRPKFEAKMLPNTGIYKLNEEVEVKGTAKAFSGANLTDAVVSYRVVRTPVWKGWWSWYYNFRDVEITNGKITTNDKGEFSVKFKALPDLTLGKNNYIVFNYKVYVDVTDINGETQSASGSITVGYIALSVDLKIENEINKEEAEEIKIITQNLNGEFIPAKGDIKVFKLDEPQQVLRERLWTRPDNNLYTEKEWYNEFPGNIYKDENNLRNLKRSEQVFDTQFDTEKDKKFNFKGIGRWKVGRYVVAITSKDKFGNEIKNEKYFTVFSDKEKEVPMKTTDWFTVLKYQCEPGDFAKFLIGSSEENVKVLYEIEHKNKIAKNEWMTLNHEQKVIEIPVTEEHRGNFAVHFTIIKNNRMYKHDETVIVPYTNKNLDIEFMTFRDKLQPGQQEEWQMKIKGAKGEKVVAEMLATLYDASLDKFRMNYWDFNIYKVYYASLYWATNTFLSSTSASYTVNTEYHPMPYTYYDSFNWFGFYYYYGGYYYEGSGGDGSKSTTNRMYKSKRAMKKNGGGDDEMLESSAEELPAAAPNLKECEKKADVSKNIAGDVTTLAQSGEMQNDRQQGKDKDTRADIPNMSDVKARTNFAETAFFYPDLKTNEKGELIVKFTIPESLTKWKMMGFAHSQDLKYGFIQKELVTQKDLMVMPNPPRFFRENDEIEFPVKISNVSDKELIGFAHVEFFDAITMKPVSNIFSENGGTAPKEFKIAAGQNTSLKWKLKIPEGVGAIDYKVVAKAGTFSDGEENVLPVLTNRMLVTESFPLPIRGKTTKTFEFTKLKKFKSSSTLRNQKLTLEFTSNPAWYAVQALPYIMEYPYECAEQVFSRFYANSLASHIANSKPKIKKVFDSWKNTPDSKALLSNLEKNQELKSLLLEETPWVLNAQDETSRKKQIGLLFDLNKMGRELNSAMKKLQDMQVSNGGWPWFPGMPESRYITQHVVCGMGHLDHLGVTSVKEDKKVWNMVEKAVQYIDNEIRKDYEDLKKWYKPKELEENHIGYTQIHYLYARSFFYDKIEISSKNKEAYNYFKDQAVKYWLQQCKYMQGMIGLALNRMGNQKVPLAIVKSLKEFSMTSEEMGMYWKDVELGYNWWQAPIETQAIMIEFFDEVAKDQQSVNDLKVWLLKQKQTQDWRTTKATVEAIYALLLKGADWLDSDELVKVKLGNLEIDPKKLDGVQVEAGTGYYKTSWAGSEIVPEMGDIIITKNDEGVSWGAVYWQYFEQLDKITPHETPLKLNKKLFIERDSKSGKIIEPLDEKVKLTVGDKVIVRIELRVDRNMEFVHMKDMRASGFEPINVISRYKWQDGLGYYESTKDAATNFFMSYMPKGTYVFEYPLRVTHNGDFSNGITQIQCMYAPEFSSHSEGIRVKVGEK